MAINPHIPLPLDPIMSNNLENRRLWVGNLDLRINEYQLLKILQKYGEIEKFDLLFHRSGPQAGQPRGYAFVTFTTANGAVNARNYLHNTKLGCKNVIVRWAHSVSEPDIDKSKPKLDIPALAGAKQEHKKCSRETTIQAIEAKLKLMKECEEEFELNKPIEGTPAVLQYQKSDIKMPSCSNSNRSYNRKYHHHQRPYSRSKFRK